ncbi:hypothetical protein FQB35_02515 [Crassaminicella thermophila]|uniref:DUF5317 domain-containing protein n=1 Tax=Crassaminicella thermophila TaxID=2599308 RepID=A0A5C0SBP2_CRATE|nr:DUF5317 domain-containing protein [Crassaminicella thermophila]QEK11332.1 hypothetical protein FQB35_02515 [Crassaminicella thermophila]
MLIEGTIIGLLLGKIRGGRLENLKFLTIRGWPLFILALILQIMLIFETPFLSRYEGYVYAISLIFLLIVLVINIDKKGFWVLLIGVTLNLLVIFLNNGKIPISFESLDLAGKISLIEGIKSGEILRYIPLEDAKTWTKFLAKCIVIPKPYPLSKVISVGNIFISLGIVLFIQGEMIRIRRRFGHRSTKMIIFQYKGQK